MVTPYFVPADPELKILKDLRQRQVRVRILTNSLESTPDPIAQSAYQRYRKPLLEDGVELYEVRSLLGSVKGSGQTAVISHYGNYALHAKLFVFDRQKIFMGSMNFDQRSKHLNTEVGLIIDIVAASQSLAADILPIVWHTGLHHPIPEQEGLISNLAFPFSPPGADMGPVYRFCANHVWHLDDPCQPFRMTFENL